MVVYRINNTHKANYTAGGVLTLPRSRSFDAKVTELHEYAHVGQEMAGMTPFDYGRDPVGKETEASALALAFIKPEAERPASERYLKALRTHTYGRGYGTATALPLLTEAVARVQRLWQKQETKEDERPRG